MIRNEYEASHNQMNTNPRLCKFMDDDYTTKLLQSFRKTDGENHDIKYCVNLFFESALLLMCDKQILIHRKLIEVSLNDR